MFIIIVFWLVMGHRVFFSCMFLHLPILKPHFLAFSSVCVNSCCSHPRVFEKTLVLELHISYIQLYRMVPYIFPKLYDRSDLRFACQKLTIIIELLPHFELTLHFNIITIFCLPSSSVYLSYLIPAVTMRKYFGQLACLRVPHFLCTAIDNGTWFFRLFGWLCLGWRIYLN